MFSPTEDLRTWTSIHDHGKPVNNTSSVETITTRPRNDESKYSNVNVQVK